MSIKFKATDNHLWKYRTRPHCRFVSHLHMVFHPPSLLPLVCSLEWVSFTHFVGAKAFGTTIDGHRLHKLDVSLELSLKFRCLPLRVLSPGMRLGKHWFPDRNLNRAQDCEYSLPRNEDINIILLSLWPAPPGIRVLATPQSGYKVLARLLFSSPRSLLAPPELLTVSMALALLLVKAVTMILQKNAPTAIFIWTLCAATLLWANPHN